MNLTFNINAIFNEKINVQLVKSAFNKNSMFNEKFQYFNISTQKASSLFIFRLIFVFKYYLNSAKSFTENGG